MNKTFPTLHGCFHSSSRAKLRVRRKTFICLYSFPYDGGTYKTIAKLVPKAKVLNGLSVEMKKAEKGDPKAIGKWLKKINF